jgi:hypothetical protein
LTAGMQTIKALIRLAREGGATVWVEIPDEKNFALRHIGASKAVMRRLREMPRDLLIEAFTEEQQVVRQIQTWVFERTLPGSAFRGSIQHFYWNYVAYCAKNELVAESQDFFASVLKYRTQDGFVTGICLIEDYKAALDYEKERIPEDDGRGHTCDLVEHPLILLCPLHGAYDDWWIRLLPDGGEMVCGRCWHNPDEVRMMIRPT